MNTIKVYCRNCKHCKWTGQYLEDQVCKLSKRDVGCSILNLHNDCNGYEEKWLTAFAEKIIVEQEEEIDNRFEILDL